MTWLRIDDGFAEHGKVLELPRADRWTWMELLCYCARQSSGDVPARIAELLRFVTPAFLARCIDAGLLDTDENGSMAVHDWAVYNPKDPTGALRQSRFRNANRNGENRDENVTAVTPRVRARARSRPDPPSPIQEGEGRNRSEETSDAAPASPNGPAPLIETMRTYVHQFWHEYPDLAVLQDELTDRGLHPDEAAHLIAAECSHRSDIPIPQ